MKTIPAFVGSIILLGLAWAGLVASPASAGSAKPAPAATNSAHADAPLPRSVFDPTNGLVRNPFFPDSVMRPVPTPVIVAPTPTITATSFKLKMISGLPGQEVVLINNRNLAVGDAPAEVTLESNEKKWIKVLKVTQSSVTIQVVGMSQTFEIFLPQSDSLLSQKH